MIPEHLGWFPVHAPSRHVLDEDLVRVYPALQVNVIVLPSL